MSELIFNYYRRFYQLCISSQPINSRLSAHRQCSNGNVVYRIRKNSENTSLFNEFVCKLGLFWHEWASLKRE
jgi:hypothetical protein